MIHYSIKDLEYLSGIKAHTIRIWEKRYRLLDPERSNTNIRSYSNEDVRRILNVAMLVKNGYKISNVASFDNAKLQSEVLRQNKNLQDPEKNIDHLLMHTLNMDLKGFELLVKNIISENGFSKTIQNIIFPFFERIGILWQAGSIYVTHEHFVSNLIRNHLIVEISKFDNHDSERTILFFLREDEMHELGLLYFNFLAAANGFRCIYLGQNVPSEDLVNLLKENEYNFICTSFIHAIEKESLEQYLAKLAKVFNKNKILIAGRQLTIHKPSLPANVVVIKSSQDFIKKTSR
ncbi:MAG TPA: MerR family transcriptional regulator [Prolixibacteraceae bacterium]|nr:MerR family transcriptional regulator [Prolixibacteraceae bacterium]